MRALMVVREDNLLLIFLPTKKQKAQKGLTFFSYVVCGSITITRQFCIRKPRPLKSFKCYFRPAHLNKTED